MNRINSSLDIVEQLIKDLENSIEKLTQNVALEWEIVKTPKCLVENRWNVSNVALIGIPEKKNERGR